MLIDVDYSHYWIGAPADDPQFGPSGTVMVNEGSVLVSTFTQGGPVNVRILVGDHAPGTMEDAWRSQWEHVQDVFVENTQDLEVRTWEYGEAEPPSGPFARPGRWTMRFHSRGQAKVAAEDNMPETALEEHLVLLWPAGAAQGGSPVWDEVTCSTAQPPWHIRELGASGRVKTPQGYYRLTGAGTPIGPTLPVPSDVGLIRVARDDLVVTSGTNKSLEVWIEGAEFSQPEESETVGDYWQIVAHGLLHSSRPVRLLDGTGAVPRRFADPLVPGGRWQIRLMVRSDEEDGLVGGLPPEVQHAGARYDQRLQIWPEGAPTRDEAYGLVGVDDDPPEAVYVDRADSGDTIQVLIEDDEAP